MAYHRMALLFLLDRFCRQSSDHPQAIDAKCADPAAQRTTAERKQPDHAPPAAAILKLFSFARYCGESAVVLLFCRNVRFLLILVLGLNCYALCRNIQKQNAEDTKYGYMYQLKYPDDEIPEKWLYRLRVTGLKRSFRIRYGDHDASDDHDDECVCFDFSDRHVSDDESNAWTALPAAYR